MRHLALLLALAASLPAADNTLSPEEKAAGFRLLFDGRTMNGWLDPAKQNAPGDAWMVEDGTLRTVLKPRISEDLLTVDQFADFELLFDWRLSERGNTGLKYRIQRTVFVDHSTRTPGPNGFEGMLGRELAGRLSDRARLAPGVRAEVYSVGFEFQLLDDDRHPDAKRGADRQTGALYSMIPADRKASKPVGEWNHSRLLVRGTHIEHWVNGVKVLEGSLDDQRIKDGAIRRWGPAPEIRDALVNPRPRGNIALQHHGDLVWFKNIKIRDLR
jgi:hypothetical protein